MRVGIIPPSIVPICTADYVRRVARAVEDFGFDSYWAPEHVVLFDSYESRNPYAADGRLNIQVGGPADPFVLLAFAAAVTSRIRIGTGICLVAQRNPVYTAKEVASLDWFSGGRFDFGIGVGWLREEFEVVDVPWERRGARTLEYLEIMKTLWREDLASYHGEFYHLPECRLHPKPVQQPHPPFVFGGETDAALRRVAVAGQGWFGFDHDPAGAKEQIARISAVLERHGRSRAEIEVNIAPHRRKLTRELYEQYKEAGVDQVLYTVGGRDADATVGQLERLAAEIFR